MTATGGPIETVSIDGRLFTPDSENNTERDLGGTRNSLKHNGNGTVRVIKTKKGWMLSGLQLECDDAREDQEFLQGVADKNGLSTVAITYASGEVYQGAGTITEDVKFSNNEATASLTLEGQGKLTKQ